MSVTFNQIPANINVPLFFAEMDNSAANTAQDSGPALLFGHMLPGAPMEPNKPVIMPSTAMAIKLAGPGSQLTRMVKSYREIDPFGELWVIGIPTPQDATVAEGHIAVAGSPSATGAINLYVGTTRVQIVVSAGDMPAAIALDIEAAINRLESLPVTAHVQADQGGEATSRTVVLTAKHAGASGNTIPLTLNFYGSSGGEELPEGLSITVQAMAGGVGDPDFSAAVAAMGDEPYDFIGTPFTDRASLSLLAMEMNDDSGRWSYARQIYGHVYTARTGGLSDLIAVGDSFNDQHLTVAGYEADTQTPVDELVACRLARTAGYLRNDPARPTQTGPLTGALPAPAGRRFTLTEQQSLLSHGIATSTVEGDTLMIQRDITTYKKNRYGVADNSYFDSESLHISAYVLRKLKSVITSKYGRHKLADDGTRFGPGQAIVTPVVIWGEMCAMYRQLEREGIVENFELFKKYLIVERNANNPNRMDVLFPPDYINQLRIFAVINQFRLQYSEEA